MQKMKLKVQEDSGTFVTPGQPFSIFAGNKFRIW